ncbi:MAG: YdcF family protein [Candidatus Nanopelagicales bacterium]
MAVGTQTQAEVRTRRRSPLRVLVRLVLALAVLFLVLLPAAAALTVVVASRTDDRTPTDAIVVLGAAQFWGDPSPVLENRLQHAADLYADDVSPRIITVGGKQPRDITTEAQAGRDWLVEAGVPRTSVTAVPTGSDTLTSLQAVADKMAVKGWTSATIVTDPAHEARSLAMARSLGIDAHGSPTASGAGSSLTLDYLARETAGLLYFWTIERWSVVPVVGQ